MRISENIRNQGGFTLIEMLVAMAMGTIVLAGIYGAHQDQLRTSITQQQIVDMNQNLRVAMYVLESDLRMAGANPTGDAPAGFVTKGEHAFVIAMDSGGIDNVATNNSNACHDDIDNDGDGTKDEGCDGNDNDGDGLIDEADEADEWYDGDITDKGEVVSYDLDGGDLRRRYNDAGSTDPTVNAAFSDHLASNIDGLYFVYLDGSDPPAETGNVEDIRYVQVSIVARSGDNVPVFMRKHTDNKAYNTPQGYNVFTAPGDQFRRVMVTTTIKCRNMGL